MKLMKSHPSGHAATICGRGRARWMMRRVCLQVPLQAALLALVFSAPGRADSIDRSAAPRGGFEAKLQYCQDCHGPSGQGYRGFYPIPRLAGQQTQYIENQLRAFVERRRPNNIMANVAHVLSPAMINALATHFRSLNPAPLGGAPKQLVAAGRQIFEGGVPDANVAACAACHGPDATGRDQIPRLAGQLYPYLVKELTNWGKERGQLPAHPDTSFIMAPVAHSLTKSEVEAVAAYLSYLK
jgi:cytochrome c553